MVPGLHRGELALKGLALGVMALGLTGAVSAAPTNPLEGARWFVDPVSNARHQADAWRASRPDDARELEKIASQPQADWFTRSGAAVAVRARVDEVARAGALPILVAYFLPLRDCGSYSAGGARTAFGYRHWIDGFARALGTRRAVVVLEPDGLAALDCLRPAQRRTRTALVRYAVIRFARQRGAIVYVDAGHSAWQPPAVAAQRLLAAGVANARGFALNVSNYRSTEEALAYGETVSRLTGGKHFVVDTSRNGRGPLGDEWCNPPDRGLGDAPTTETASPLADAYLWIKRPGESDGTCNGGPPAGAWWPERALELARLSRRTG